MPPRMPDPDLTKGAVESDDPAEDTPVTLSGQLPHRTDDPLIKENDSDFPEPGESPEHSGQRSVDS